VASARRDPCPDTDSGAQSQNHTGPDADERQDRSQCADHDGGTDACRRTTDETDRGTVLDPAREA